MCNHNSTIFWITKFFAALTHQTRPQKSWILWTLLIYVTFTLKRAISHFHESNPIITASLLKRKVWKDTKPVFFPLRTFVLPFVVVFDVVPNALICINGLKNQLNALIALKVVSDVQHIHRCKDRNTLMFVESWSDHDVPSQVFAVFMQ